MSIYVLMSMAPKFLISKAHEFSFVTAIITITNQHRPRLTSRVKVSKIPKEILGPNLYISQSGAFAKQISIRRSKK